MSKIIISCAITGSIHTPSMSPYLPITAEQIARQSIDAWKSGASIIHLHARNPENGKPSSDVRHFMAFLPEIKKQSDAVINISTGGSAIMSLEQRMVAAKSACPEMCSVNMGSMNFALYTAAKKITSWKYGWEKPFLENSDDLIFKNTPRDILHVITRMGKRGSKFEFECYDLSQLYMLRHFADRNLISPPYFIQFVFGVLGGIAADPENLTYMLNTATRLFKSDFQWSVLAAGRHQMPFATMAAAMGGHVRVGLEDNLFISKGELAKDNAQQVSKIRNIVEQMGRKVATAEETREILELKGKQNTSF